MKIGSLVELVNDRWGSNYIEGVIYPIRNKVYTVRGFTRNKDGELFILLDEIVNAPRLFYEGYIEPAFYISRFRELLTIDNIEEYINTNSLEKVAA